MMDSGVMRPVPESQRTDDRQYQLSQLRRRFGSGEKQEAEATVLTFNMKPTDPDFPFEMTALQCVLLVPQGYPGQGRPSLRVTNADMDRGYQINVERGFDALVASMPGRTLLTLFNQLDRRLESLLVAEKAQTVKLVTNATGKKPSATPIDSSTTTKSPDRAPVSMPRHSAQQLAEAQSKRESDVRQLEARMGRQALFAKSPDGLSFSVPLQIHRPSSLPVSLQSVKSFRLLVPGSYHLEPCSIVLTDGHSVDTNRVEAAFQRHARVHPEMTLTAHVNYLTQNMHTMVQEVTADAPESASPPLPVVAVDEALQTSQKTAQQDFEDRPHLHIIARPPEWSMPRNEDHVSDSSGDYDTDDESGDSTHDDDDDGGGAVLPQGAGLPSDPGPDRGVRLSFPALELYGTELLQLSSLSLTVKCNRCKEVRDVKNIKPCISGDQSLVKRESCSKCADEMRISYRSEPMHSSSVRAGYVDVDGCTIQDLLPSNFIPTCSQCSSPHPGPGVVSVRGESTMAVCRECHQKMSFKLPDVKFLRMSSLAGTRTNRPLPARKRPKEHLGIVSGEKLPRQGRCRHYAKSYRWFRFGCCSKVYPCDRCHDTAEEHANEHANRMICGFCSREQNYRPEDCIHCHFSLVRKHASGFWEGGKGTRDPSRMSRKDPRKYKRRGGGATGGAKK